MDGHFVPNLTFGPPVLAGIRQATDLLLDVHLMVDQPEAWLEPFAEAGADSLVFHIESTAHSQRLATQIRDLGCTCLLYTSSQDCHLGGIYLRYRPAETTG